MSQAKVLHSDAASGKSLRRGFVELDLHEHALCALRELNGNPEVFGPAKRPIVEFAIDNREIVNNREAQIQKLKQQAANEGKGVLRLSTSALTDAFDSLAVITDLSFGFGKKKRKGKNERQREKKNSTETPPAEMKSDSTETPDVTRKEQDNESRSKKRKAPQDGSVERQGEGLYLQTRPKKVNRKVRQLNRAASDSASSTKRQKRDKLDDLADDYESSLLTQQSTSRFAHWFD